MIVRFVVTERRVIRSINYEGIHSVTVSEILDRFKERKVGLSVESQYDPDKVQRAAVVLKEFLAERGRQYATVDPQIEQIPPSSLKVTFNVNEGPKVKVGDITDHRQQGRARTAGSISHMKNLHPYGIPHSIVFENLFAKTFDQAKLEEDKERIRAGLSGRGLLQAKTLEDTVKIVPTRRPRMAPAAVQARSSPGIAADITIPVEEGRLYHLQQCQLRGRETVPRAGGAACCRLFGMRQGDVFSTDKLRKGIENMRKLYGQFGYIDFVPEPSFDFIPNTDQIDLTITADEGKQFFIRRIDFSGNTTTRDKVIRREILLDEGDMFNTQLVGLQHSAPQPARLFRDAEEGRGRRHQAQSQYQHRGYHAQGEGARQELHRIERRRFGNRRQLRGVQLLHQQLPGPGRNPVARIAARHASCAT